MEVYRIVTLQLAQAGGVCLFSRVTAGVLQGSPLSGSLFVLVMDTLVAALTEAIPSGLGGV